ncbi:MAG: YfiR family protein [Methylococcales bacterium]|nr:YfiR family protein [Methylococcales bacterium]
MKVFIIFCGLISGFISAQSYASKPKIASEEKLKAIYLVHISQLTTWLKKPSVDTFSICINKAEEISKKLKEIENHLIKKRPLKIQYNLSPEQLLKCDVFYVSASEISLFEKYKSELEKHAVLTISSEVGFTENYGGIIRYYVENDKVKMQVNLESMRKTELNMSSKLLRLMKP